MKSFTSCSWLLPATPIAGEVEGTYLMRSGGKQVDTTLEVWVAVESTEESLERLRQMVAAFGAVLGQETMYFDRTGSKVEFIEAEEPRRSDHG
jgi:hypothetical protein